MKRHLLLSLICAAFATSAGAADLLTLYREALSNDASYAGAIALLEANREKGPQARAGLLPDIKLTGATTYTRLDAREPTAREAAYNSNSYTVTLTQPLFRWQNWVAAKQGALQVGVAEAQFDVAQNDLIVRVAQAYFDVLYAEDVLTSVQALRGASDQQLQLSRKSFEVGTVTVTDVNEAQSKFDLASAQEITAANDLEIKRQALRVLTGKEPAALARLRAGLQISAPLPADMEQWVRQAQLGNPSLLAQRLSQEIAKRDLERLRAAHLPTLDLVGSYGRSHSDGSSSSSSSSLSSSNALSLQLTVPIFQGGATQSKVRESAALLDKANADLSGAQRNVAQSVRQAYLGVSGGVAQVRGYEAAVRSSQSALESNKLGYEVGVRINIDVLNAQTSLADTQQKLAKSRYDTLINLLKLKAAAGSLSADDVQQLNDLLEK